MLQNASVLPPFMAPRHVLLLSAGAIAVMLASGCGDGADAPDRSADADVDTSVSASATETTSPRDSLSEAQQSRLGPALRRLLTGDTTGSPPSNLRKISPAGSRDGEKVYSVLIEGAGAEVLRKAGIPHVSEAGNLVTARLTTGQIRKAASIDAVRNVRLPKQARAQ